VLSLTQPVQISIGNTFNTLVDPDSIAGNWNNLRWYAVLLGQQLKANPVLVGDVLYLPCEITVPTDSGLQTFGGILGIATDPYRLQPDLAQYKDQAATFPPFRRSRQDPPLRVSIHRALAVHRRPDYRSVRAEWPTLQEFLREFFRRYRGATSRRGAGLSPIAVGDGSAVDRHSRR
jgi:hypothetical protein